MLWAEREMAGAQVTHGKERVSLTAITAKLAHRPDLSFSAAVGDASRQAAHRILAKEQIVPEGLLQGHFEQTAQRIRRWVKPGSLLLVLQDTMVVDFSKHPSIVGLGPTNDSGLGAFAHGALCCTDEGLPLGIIALNLWARDPDQPGTRKSKRERPYVEKESYKWARALHKVQERIDPNQLTVVIQDREGDIFAFFAQPRRETVHLLVRASEPRNVEVVKEKDTQLPTTDAEELPVSLFEAVEQAPVLGTLSITVPRKGSQKEREATLNLRAQAVRLLAPQNGHKKDPKQPQLVWVVQAIEENLPKEVTPICWTLISTMAVTDLQQARMTVQRYTRRWLIERLHYTLKSGCSIEKLQIDDAWSLFNVIAVYYVVAWRLLHLTYLGRLPDDVPAEETFDAEELLVLTRLNRSAIKTTAQAVVAIAKLGGYTQYRNAQPPGVKVLWLGFRYLQAMVEGYRIASAPPTIQ